MSNSIKRKKIKENAPEQIRTNPEGGEREHVKKRTQG